MDYLADSNILLRLPDRTAPEHAIIRTAVRTILLRGDRLFFVPQSLYEFWVVSTRPTTARGGFGLTVTETDRRLRLIERILQFLPDDPTLPVVWRQMVLTNGIVGVAAHDARLVAAMQIHGITQILTLNTTDFARYPGITAVHPREV